MHAHPIGRLFLLGVLAGCLALVSASTASATQATLTGGESSSWTISDVFTTTNGWPTGGTCTLDVGQGAAILDASLPGQPDAFDGGALVYVDDSQVGASGAFTSNEAVFTPLGGSLATQLKYRALPGQATLRVLARIRNAGFGPRWVLVRYVSNFGSDGSTQLTGASTGGNYGRWMVTDDASTTADDPAVTSVFMGPGEPPELSPGTLETVFACAGTEGAWADASFTIRGGETATLMFFQQLNPSSGEAVAEASQYDTTPAFGTTLTEGMTAEEYRNLVNWSVTPECQDGLDNDGDTRIDFPRDKQCESASDRSELPQCNDGFDNDLDGFTDFDMDFGCTRATDRTEAPNPQCADQEDNDGDGRVDYWDDPGCTSDYDDSELDPACSDGLDNDGDGKIDHPADPGCSKAADETEAPNPACSDGVDNDGDGAIDLPADPGCKSVRDKDEVNPRCNDGLDNDGDGQVDYPADTGCTRLSDNTE